MLPLQTTPQIPELDTINIPKAVVETAHKLAETPFNQIVSELGNKAIAFGLKVLAALVIYIVGAWLIKRIKKFLAGIFERKKTDRAIASFTQSLVSISLTVLLIIITVSTLGINTTSLAAILAAGGMAIGMALSGTVQNFAGGIMLLIFKPFKAGDFIEAQGYTGTVTEINIVSTKLTTTDNRSIIIPNGVLSNNTINNYSQNSIRRLEWLVDVEYGCVADEVKEALKSIVAGEEKIMLVATGAPADPLIEVNALRDSSVQFIVRAWASTDDYWNIFYSVNSKIYEELPKRGIQFPYPQLDVHINNQQ